MLLYLVSLVCFCTLLRSLFNSSTVRAAAGLVRSLWERRCPHTLGTWKPQGSYLSPLPYARVLPLLPSSTAQSKEQV